MSTARRAFVVMPFGKKKVAGRNESTATASKAAARAGGEGAGLDPHRADADRRGG